MNAEIAEIDKQTRTTMRGGKDKKRLHTQAGFMSTILGTTEALNTVSAHAETVGSFVQQYNSVLDAVKYDGSNREQLMENFLSRMEDLAALIVGIQSTDSWQNCFCLVHLYIRTHFTQSVSLTIMQWILQALKCPGKILKTQSGVEYTSTEEMPTSISTLKSAIRDWKTFRTSDLARNLANVVDILVSVGCVPCEDPKKMVNPFRSTEFGKFSTRVWDVQLEALDFTSMIFDTVIFFLERGYVACVEKDVTLLLYSDSETHLLDLEFALLSSALPLLECGRLSELADRMNENLIRGVKPIVDSSDFDNRVDKMIMRISYLMKFEKHPAAKAQLAIKLNQMSKLRTALILQQRTSPIREKPFCIEIFGGSSVAKTTLCNIFARVVLHHNGFASTKDHIVTCNDLDKYQSEYTSAKNAVVLDDYGNTRAEHYDIAPTKKIIDFCNNVNLAALNAEVEKKGNVMIRPKVVIITTNEKALLAHQFSNEPTSIQRRMEVVVTAKLKPEYTDSATGGPIQAKMANQAIPDAWDLLVETVQIIRGSQNDTTLMQSVFTKPHPSGTTVPRMVGIMEALEKLKEMSEIHFANQEAYVSCVENFFETEFCPHSYPPQSCPQCARRVPTPLAMEFECAHGIPGRECGVCVNEYIATMLQEKSRLQSHAGRETRNQRARNILKDFDKIDDPDSCYFDVALQAGDEFIAQVEKEEEETTSFSDYFTERRVRILAGFGVIAGVVSTLYVAYRIYRAIHPVLEVQGNVVGQPIKLESDVANPWKKVKPLELPTTLDSKTTTVETITTLLQKKIGFALIRPAGSDEERKVCDIMPMCSDRWLLPWHIVKDSALEYELEVRTQRDGVLGKQFKQLIGAKDFERIPNTDYVIVRLANGGDNYDFTKFLPLGKVELGWSRAALFAKTVLKLADGTTELETVRVHARQVVNTEIGDYDAYCYNYPKPTFSGQCMMALVSDSASPCILGFHLAGRTGETFGAAGVILQQWFNETNDKITLRAPLNIHSSGTFRATQAGTDFKPSLIIDDKHATKWMSNDPLTGQAPCLEVYGSHPQGTVRFKSNVRKSPISDHVASVMGLPRHHGAPNTSKGWKHWQRDLDLISKPKGLFRPKILQQATEDLHRKIKKFMTDNPDTVALIHPYDTDTILAGVDGITSVDGVDLKTSMGWPINAAKSNFITPSDRVIPNVTRSLDLDPVIMAEVEYTEEILASGVRYYAINRGTKKDEAVKFSKDKIRIFAGAQYVTIHNTRKYYLPLVRFIQTHWKDFECAVGINAHGPQWDELTKWMTIHGEERMIAGDFKAFDKSISPTLMTEAFGILISMAKRAGYDDNQITVMEGLATELCYPMYEWDGVFVQAFGSNPSGHPLTVIINNIANSLYMRYAYYAMHEGTDVPDFAKMVRLMCYGDDNFQNVSPEETRYNFTTVQQELAKVGIVFTTADKDVDKVETLIPIEKVSFLKRGFLYRSDLSMWVAPLEEESISKSLHNYLHQKGSVVLPTQISGQVIGGALREYFRYPKEIFEKKREQLISVAALANVTPYVPSFLTYEELRDEIVSGTYIPLPEFPLDLECA